MDREEGDDSSSLVSVPGPSQSSEKKEQHVLSVSGARDHDDSNADAGTPAKSLSSQPTDCDVSSTVKAQFHFNPEVRLSSVTLRTKVENFYRAGLTSTTGLPCVLNNIRCSAPPAATPSHTN